MPKAANRSPQTCSKLLIHTLRIPSASSCCCCCMMAAAFPAEVLLPPHCAVYIATPTRGRHHAPNLLSQCASVPMSLCQVHMVAIRSPCLLSCKREREHTVQRSGDQASLARTCPQNCAGFTGCHHVVRQTSRTSELHKEARSSHSSIFTCVPVAVRPVWSTCSTVLYMYTNAKMV